MKNKADPDKGKASTKSIEIVSDPERIRIMLDETRSEILKIIKMGTNRQGKPSYDLSVGEISDRIGSAPQRIYFHVDKLVECGFLEKSREVKKKRSKTTYYKRTAMAFIINYNTDNPPKDITTKTEEWVRNMLSSFDIILDRAEIYTLFELVNKLWQRSSILIEKLSTKVSTKVSYKEFDRTFGFLNDLMLHNDEEVREIRDNISSIIIPKLLKPDIETETEIENEIRPKIELNFTI